MHLTGYVGLLFSLLAFLFLACWAGSRPGTTGSAPCPWWSGARSWGPERDPLLGIMLIALMSRDYTFHYVYENVDNALDFVYTMTAFWGGRKGPCSFGN